jgi:hypothetical protein
VSDYFSFSNLIQLKIVFHQKIVRDVQTFSLTILQNTSRTKSFMNISHLFWHVENCCIQALKGQIPSNFFVRRYLSNKVKDLPERISQGTFLWKSWEIKKKQVTYLYVKHAYKYFTMGESQQYLRVYIQSCMLPIHLQNI